MDLMDSDPCPEDRRWTKPVIRQTAPRHELVTARAISRLSHSVAQLSASNNKHSQGFSRLSSRSKFGRQDYAHSNFGKTISDNVHDSKLDGIDKAATGSKRKWQPDSRKSHVSMDVDDHTRNLSTMENLRRKSSVNISGIPMSRRRVTVSNEVNRNSGCSPMVSLSTSPSSSSPSSPSNDRDSGPSSDENEADAEGDGDESGSHSCCASPAHSRTSISPFGVLGSHKLPHGMNPAAVHSKRISRASRGSICGGDSSDGLSVNMKIPRLTNWPCPLSGACKSMSVSHPIDISCQKRETGNHRLFYGYNRGMHQHRLQLRRDKSDSMLIEAQEHVIEGVEGSVRVRRNSASASSQPWDSGKAGRSSASTSSCSRGNSPSNSSRRPESPGSCEDLANDEQSDFPADELLPSRYGRSHGLSISDVNTYRGSVPRLDKSFSHSRRHFSSRHCPASWRLASSSTLPSGSPDLNDMDSEWEEAMQGTWQLLTHRARLDYLRGTFRANFQSEKPSPLVGLTPVDSHRMDFVPSKLADAQMNHTNCSTSSNVGHVPS